MAKTMLAPVDVEKKKSKKQQSNGSAEPAVKSTAAKSTEDAPAALKADKKKDSKKTDKKVSKKADKKADKEAVKSNGEVTSEATKEKSVKSVKPAKEQKAASSSTPEPVTAAAAAVPKTVPEGKKAAPEGKKTKGKKAARMMVDDEDGIDEVRLFLFSFLKCFCGSIPPPTLLLPLCRPS